MARSRVYRHDVRCPDCGSNRMRKDGFSNGRQAYSCGDCRRRYLPGGACHWPGPAVKARAVEMSVEGSSLSAIGRVLEYSAPAVLGWVKKGGGEGRGQHTLLMRERVSKHKRLPEYRPVASQ